MRIISGSFKGKKILEPNDATTRPLKDLTKESIFNILTHSNKFKINIKKSVILDLFSGVGSFGIECLSRGVEKVIFVENYIGVLPILKKNLSLLKELNNYQIIEKDIYKDNFSSEINSNWIKNPTAENVKKEFQENAKCIDSKIYDAFLIT